MNDKVTIKPPPYLSNAALSLVVLAITTSLALVFTPFLLSRLGAERYGVWVLAFSVVQITLLLDLGFTSATRRFQAAAFASESSDESSLVLGASLRFYVPAGLAGLVVFAVIAGSSPEIVAVPDELLFEVRVLIVALGLHLLLVLWRAPFAGILFGSGNVGLDRLFSVLPRMIVFVVGTALITWWRPNLESMAVAVTAGAIGSFAATVLVVRVKWPQLKGRHLFSSNRMFRPMARFGASVLLLSLGGAALQWFPQVIVGRELGFEAVAFLAIPLLMVGMIYQVMQAIGLPVFPVASRVNAAGKVDALAALYRTSTRIQLAAASTVAMPVAILAEVLIRFWIGDEFAWTGSITAILLAGQLFRFGAIPGRHLLTATRRVRALGVAEVVYAVVVVASLSLAAAAVGSSTQETLIAVALILSALTAVYFGFVVPAFACRELQMGYARLIVRLYSRLLPLVFGLAAVGYWTSNSIAIVSIPTVAFALTSITAATAVPLFLLYLDNAERQLIVDRLGGLASSIRSQIARD